MEQSKKLVKKTKRTFILYTLIGMGLVFVVSYFSLKLHNSIIEEQASIQKMYSMIGQQFNLVNKISILSEKFKSYDDDETSVELEQKFKQLLVELNDENQKMKMWLAENRYIDIKNMEEILKQENLETKILLFIRRASELVNNEKLTNLEIKQHVRFLTDSSRDGLGDVLVFVANKLEERQEESLSMLNKVGFVLVGLCILQVVLVWFMVFKPLYTTVMIQHERISDALLRAESASRSKTDFLANISHEIRTPMTAILGYADILKRDAISQDEKVDAVKIIDQNANHLLGLIDEILDISKIEAGKVEFENEEVNLTTFLNEVYSLINVKAQDKGIQLIFKNKGKIPVTIQTDPKRLKQMLFNIIGNAIKFTDEGYVELMITFDKTSNLLSLRVKDTGTGISEQQQKRLFRPFEQADSSVARRYGGTGLGLVLSKGIARVMGGDVRIIESSPGVGTTMEILVDIGMENNLELIPTFSTSIVDEKVEEIPDNKLRDARILIVDDAKENARLFKLYLSEAGADVDIANDGDTAIDLATRKCFDLVLLDLQMPGKDGFQVIKELREKSFDNPVIALTAHAMKEEKEKTKEAGFDAHITKPVKANVLVDSVSEQIHSQTFRA
jgi:signal transduction histidine kinase/CheY-like chemotaxis protein